MATIFTFLLLVVISSAFAFLLDAKFEQTVSVACFAIVLLMYVFGIVGHLLLGFKACLIVFGIALAYCIYCTKKNKGLWKQDIFTPGFFVFCFMYIVFLWGFRGYFISGNDEFSHWGRVVKDMFFLDSFGSHPRSTTGFKEYPPATALFQYFYSRIAGNFTESNICLSLQVLMFSMWLPIFRKINWKKKQYILPIFILILLLPLVFFGKYYTTIDVDATLGVLFGYIIFTYCSVKTMNKLCLVSLFAGTAVLTLTKPSGAGLAAIACAIITVDCIRKFKTRDNVERRQSRRVWLPSFGMFCSLVVAKYSWNIYLKITNSVHVWRMDEITLNAMFELLKGNAPHYKYQVINTFVGYFFRGAITNYFLGISYFQWLILFGILSLSFIKTQKSKKLSTSSQFNIVALGLTAGAVVYAMILLILYIFIFGEYEAVRIASADRYLSTYLLGMAYVIVMLLYNSIIIEHQTKKWISRRIIFATGCLFLFSNPLPLINFTLFAPYRNLSTRRLRNSYSELIAATKKLNTEIDRVNVICNCSPDPYEWLSTSYILTPIKSGVSVSIGTPQTTIALKNWLKSLREGNYTFVYIFCVDDQFRNEFGGAFKNKDDIGNNRMYKILSVGDKTELVLRRM